MLRDRRKGKVGHAMRALAPPPFTRLAGIFLPLTRLVVPLLTLLAVLLPGSPATQAQTKPKAPQAQEDAATKDLLARGKYVFRTAGGCSCHGNSSGGGNLAGGRPLRTPFGIFYGTNITPDRTHGIGAWSDADFIRAMTEGRAPDGRHYFPVFPYAAYTHMTREDLLALKAYLFSRPAVPRANRPHLVLPPFGIRLGVLPWKLLFFTQGELPPDPARDAEWHRGRYLVEGPGHCAQCHTPRNLLGGLKAGMAMGGAGDGPEHQLAPNITPHETTGIGRWSVNDLSWYLETGLKPDGDDSQGLMAELIEHGFGRLRPEDRAAIAAYLRSIPPVNNALLKR